MPQHPTIMGLIFLVPQRLDASNRCIGACAGYQNTIFHLIKPGSAIAGAAFWLFEDLPSQFSRSGLLPRDCPVLNSWYSDVDSNLSSRPSAFQPLEGWVKRPRFYDFRGFHELISPPYRAPSATSSRVLPSWNVSFPTCQEEMSSTELVRQGASASMARRR